MKVCTAFYFIKIVKNYVDNQSRKFTAFFVQEVSSKECMCNIIRHNNVISEIFNHLATIIAAFFV